MNDQVEIRKRLSKTDFAYTRWYQLPQGHILHVVWLDDIRIKIRLTSMDTMGVVSVPSQVIYRYDSVDLENYIKSLNRYLRKILTS